MRAEFWNISCAGISFCVYNEGDEDWLTVTRETCFMGTPPRVPEADLTTMVGFALVDVLG